ncbi:MAG: DsbA family oxidoreductase [Burkholderiaceae bacterium]
MTIPTIEIDFVSDVACPWCAVGLAALEQAAAQVAGVANVRVRFQPFELNPKMPPGGMDAGEYLTRKYGATPEQQAATRRVQCERAAEAGFVMRAEGRGRIYNTFAAHRLLHWAALQDAAAGQAGQGKQRALKMALLSAYFGQGLSPESPAVLLEAARLVGLDEEGAAALLASDEFASEVRAQEDRNTQAGIDAVPTLIFNDEFLISGAQPAAVLEETLRQIAGQLAG